MHLLIAIVRRAMTAHRATSYNHPPSYIPRRGTALIIHTLYDDEYVQIYTKYSHIMSAPAHPPAADDGALIDDGGA